MFLEGVQGTGRPKAIGSPGGSSTTDSVGEQSDRFMKILLAQLRNQNPLEPMSNEKFVSQMAQLTTLQETTKLRESMEAFTQSSQTNKFLSLLGKNVIAKTPSEEIAGEVSRVKFTENDSILVIGNKEVSSGELMEIGLLSSKSNS